MGEKVAARQHAAYHFGAREKATGLSEFSYSPFRSTEKDGPKPVFDDWFDERYKRSLVVREFPTVDGKAFYRTFWTRMGVGF